MEVVEAYIKLAACEEEKGRRVKANSWIARLTVSNSRSVSYEPESRESKEEMVEVGRANRDNAFLDRDDIIRLPHA